MTITGYYINERLKAITDTEFRQILDCLVLWQDAGWSGDAYKYHEATNLRDAILDELLGEGTQPSKSDNTPNGDNTTLGDN